MATVVACGGLGLSCVAWVLGWFGMAMVWLGVVWGGLGALVWLGMAWGGLGWRGLDWVGLGWFGVAWVVWGGLG